MHRSPLPLLLSALAWILPAISFGQIVWETDFPACLAKAEAEKRPILLLYSPNFELSAPTFADAEVQQALKEFVCVRVYGETAENAKKYTQGLAGFPSMVFIDARSETVIASELGYNLPPKRFMGSVITARAAAGLPLTPEMQRSLALKFDINQSVVDRIITAGDVPGLLNYLKPVRNDDFRRDNFVAVRLQCPPAVDPADITFLVLVNERPYFHVFIGPSKVALVRAPRTTSSIKIRISAPGCEQIQQTIPLDDKDPTLASEFTLSPVPPPRLASLRGRVTWPGGRPAVNAIVRLCDPSVVTRTNSGGFFTIPSIAPGKYLLRAEISGGEFQSEIELAPSQVQKQDLTLAPVATVGIRWAIQTVEGSPQFSGGKMQTGEAFFSSKNSRFQLQRGANVPAPMPAGGDFFFVMQIRPDPAKKGTIEEFRISLLEAARHPSGLHFESGRFDTITAVNNGQPFDGSTYFERTKGMVIQVGQVFTVRCVRRDCYAKVEITDINVTPGKR